MLEESATVRVSRITPVPCPTARREKRPAVLLDYFPPDFNTFIDESHVTLPQVGAMYEETDRESSFSQLRFQTASALDNRPLKAAEFEKVVQQRIYVSATPGKSELAQSARIVEQVIRPTGLLDPEIDVRPTEGQMENLYGEIRKVIVKKQRVLVTTLTKKMSEDLTDYFASLGLKVRYLHSKSIPSKGWRSLGTSDSECLTSWWASTYSGKDWTCLRFL
jgi:excinuclease ABC subunit B